MKREDLRRRQARALAWVLGAVLVAAVWLRAGLGVSGLLRALYISAFLGMIASYIAGQIIDGYCGRTLKAWALIVDFEGTGQGGEFSVNAFLAATALILLLL